MFEDSHKRTFFSAPQSVQSLVAAFLEPGITVLTFITVTLLSDERMDRPALTLCLLVFALTFPGRDRFRESLLGAAVDIVSSWVVLLAILALCAYATKSFHFFEDSVLIAWAIATPVLQWLATWLGRTIARRRERRPGLRRTAVVVGASALGVKVARALQGGDSPGIEFLGFFDDRADERVDDDAKQRILGRLADVAAYTTEKGVREVYITLPLGSQPRIVELLEQLQGTTASLFFVPDVFGISIIQGRLQDMNGVPVVGICETPFTGTNELVKRASDLVIASLIVVLISPLLLAIAIGVKLSSPGPVLFRQRRNGLDGHEIVVYKFRSMRTLEDGAVVRQATRNDPRVTPFGAFLRRTSFDELPQFFNVLQGTMSIVGPRPHAVTHNKEYRQIIKAYMVRHKVKPGITGWAQVNGQRGETDTVEKMRTRVEYDLEYLRNWSLGLDLKIIVQTIKLVFFDRHAY
ncbi:MAG TPA: undecaprenyl-phosphate glucose phosphotransferase [Caldimonas sp.]|jgi:putative colanic acid biosynthesis UDP-glucose lipid carrier transferase|nr:undecaprenyl-phosphate glucose phosphotransferase [Caldimonas sp.]